MKAVFAWWDLSWVCSSSAASSITSNCSPFAFSCTDSLLAQPACLPDGRSRRPDSLERVLQTGGGWPLFRCGDELGLERGASCSSRTGGRGDFQLRLPCLIR